VSEHVERHIYSPTTSGTSSADGIIFAGQESAAQSIPGNNLTPPALLQFVKKRKLSIERSELTNQVLLQNRYFFHSHKAQPMSLEQVMAEEDNEDEVDDDVADLEDRRMFDDFLDVTQYEKRMMHLWNSFIKNNVMNPGSSRIPNDDEDGDDQDSNDEDGNDEDGNGNNEDGNGSDESSSASDAE
ncbi:polycomb group protein embryonic flower 2-like protein isoform X4, partial [Tanacetum coccineum]